MRRLRTVFISVVIGLVLVAVQTNPAHASYRNTCNDSGSKFNLVISTRAGGKGSRMILRPGQCNTRSVPANYGWVPTGACAMQRDMFTDRVWYKGPQWAKFRQTIFRTIVTVKPYRAATCPT